MRIDMFNNLLFNNWMDTIEQTRAKRLLMLITEYGSSASLADTIGVSESQLSQWKNNSIDSKTKKPRSLGSEKAREIEIKTNKTRGWMDQPVVDETQKFLDALETIRSMPKDKVIMVKNEFPFLSDGEEEIKKGTEKK